MRIALWVLGISTIIYLAICAALFWWQRSLIYFPQPRSISGPANTLILKTADAELVVTVRHHDGPKALIYFGGNGQDVSASLPSFDQAFPDRAIYMLHYRAFGGSTGSSTEENIAQDALALFDRVRAKHADITLAGRSLGSGVAIRLASQRPVSRLALITPYNSIEEIAAGQFPYIPVRWLLKDKFESWRYAKNIRVPTLLLAAEADEMIPAASTQRLLTNFAPGIARLVVLQGEGHNTLSENRQYLEALRAALP
ncbi:MAG: alpha/beta hydrolase [Pseudomonadota bacterium]